jgi:TrmH family RNA methyltransferase
MLTRTEQERLAVVLVGARNPSNIGAAARAMQDFGFSDLRIANDFSAPFEAAQLEAAQPDAEASAPKSAVGAAHVMHNARRFDHLLDAIADCTFVIGTTAMGDRGLKQPVLPLREAGPLIIQQLRTAAASTTGHVALLFGSEKTGLTNEQLSHCELLTTIPMFEPAGARHLSMNLGQSVAVCLYELARTGFEQSRELPITQEAPATIADRERLTQYVLKSMEAIGYTKRFPANAREHVVRQLAYRLGASHLEATTWMAFFKQVLRRDT